MRILGLKTWNTESRSPYWDYYMGIKTKKHGTRNNTNREISGAKLLE